MAKKANRFSEISMNSLTVVQANESDQKTQNQLQRQHINVSTSSNGLTA